MSDGYLEGLAEDEGLTIIDLNPALISPVLLEYKGLRGKTERIFVPTRLCGKRDGASMWLKYLEGYCYLRQATRTLTIASIKQAADPETGEMLDGLAFIALLQEAIIPLDAHSRPAGPPAPPVAVVVRTKPGAIPPWVLLIMLFGIAAIVMLVALTAG